MLIFSSNDCTIKDSFSFAEEGSSFDCGHCITSIGTGSLFTNIPLEKTTKTSKLKIIFKSPSKIVSHFQFKDVLPKNFVLASLTVLSVIAATLFVTAKQNCIFTSEQLNIWEFCIRQTNILKLLSNQLLQITIISIYLSRKAY